MGLFCVTKLYRRSASVCLLIVLDIRDHLSPANRNVYIRDRNKIANQFSRLCIRRFDRLQMLSDAKKCYDCEFVISCLFSRLVLPQFGAQ